MSDKTITIYDVSLKMQIRKKLYDCIIFSGDIDTMGKMKKKAKGKDYIKYMSENLKNQMRHSRLLQITREGQREIPVD